MKFEFTIKTKENDSSLACPYPNSLEECERQIIELAKELEYNLSSYDCYADINNRTITVDIQKCTKEEFVKWTKPIFDNYKCYLEVFEFKVIN